MTTDKLARKDVRTIEGLRWLAEVQQSHAAQWALERIAELEEKITADGWTLRSHDIDGD